MHVDQITEMAAVMRKAIEIDEQQGCKEQERIFQLEVSTKSENLWQQLGSLLPLLPLSPTAKCTEASAITF